MRNIGTILLVLALLAVFMLPGLARQASEAPRVNSADLGPFPGLTGTPVIVFPQVFQAPTSTPTPTPTPTSTATKTAVPTATRTGVPGATGLTGRLLMQKARYYAQTEWIFFLEQIYNPTGHPIAYTILGVDVSGPFFHGYNKRFHTSWTGAPDVVSAGCWGPTGLTDWNTGHRCAPNQNEGWHQDHIGASSNVEITDPGHYWVDFWACLSSYFQCTTANQPATWVKLGEGQFDADPPPAAAQAAHSATPVPQTTCRLVTDDPNNIYLDCKDGLP